MPNLNEIEDLLTRALAAVKELNKNAVITDLMSLVKTDAWPIAVPPILICYHDYEKEDRAEFALHSIGKIKGKFLDYGCGEGHIAEAAASIAELSVGYDLTIKGNLNWDKEKPLLTTDFNKVKSVGPFDTILMYDVLDHTTNPEEMLTQVGSVLAPDGKIIVRCHPWCSRHGSHLYKDLNKAYIHLIFTPEELKTLGVEDTSPWKVIRPISSYDKLFQKTGFIVTEEPKKETLPVEDFFSKNAEIKKRIMNSMALNEWTTFQIEQSHLVYTLKQKKAEPVASPAAKPGE